jgi:hypothetical protein
VFHLIENVIGMRGATVIPIGARQDRDRIRRRERVGPPINFFEVLSAERRDREMLETMEADSEKLCTASDVLREIVRSSSSSHVKRH